MLLHAAAAPKQKCLQPTCMQVLFIEIYRFNIKYIFIRHHKKRYYFSNVTSGCYATIMLLKFFFLLFFRS